MPSSSTINTRQEFNAIMKNRNSAPTRRIESANDSLSGPTHPTFDRREEMKTQRLQEVSVYLSSLIRCWTSGPTNPSRIIRP